MKIDLNEEERNLLFDICLGFKIHMSNNVWWDPVALIERHADIMHTLINKLSEKK